MKQTWKATSIIIAVSLLISLAGFASPLFADDSQEESFASDRLIVQFELGMSGSDMAQVHQQLGGELEASIPELGVQVVSVPHHERFSKSQAYRSHSKVRCVEPDYVAGVVDVPNDPYFDNDHQWGMFKVKAAEAWDITHGSSNICVAILDTGIDSSHPDLGAKVLAKKNFSSSSTAEPVNDHGTHVAGIAAAITDNGVGVAGLGYNSSLMNVKVLDDDGTGYYSWIAQGIVWATDNGADVINLSLGGSSFSSTLEQAVDYAWNHGVVVVAAAGNDGSSGHIYPAYYDNCIAVAATDASDNLASWSNYGSWVDVAAPGSAYSTKTDGQYGYMAGTSMASPHVAGLAGLVFPVASDSNGNGRLNDEVRSRIEDGSDDVGINVAHGRINAYGAVQGSSSPPSPPSAGQISGTVTDADTREAISGATVNNGTTSAATNSNGSYTISNVPQGSYSITASANGYQSSSRTITVSSGQTSIANFSLTREASATDSMWAESITFSPTGSELQIKVKVVNSEPVRGARVRLNLKQDGRSIYNGYGSTNSAGEASYRWRRATGGEYLATITYLRHSQYTWDESQGVTSASYTLGSESPSTDSMWAESITFSPTGSELQIKVKVVNSEPVRGARVRLNLKQDGRTIYNGYGSTNSAGEASYRWRRATGGEYLATITYLRHSQYTWDESQGVTSASYTLDSESPSASTMWVESIDFTPTSSELQIKVKVVNSEPVRSVRVRLNLKQNGRSIYNGYGSTNSAGEASYRWRRATGGEYLATVTYLRHSQYTWDESQGVTSASYTLGGGSPSTDSMWAESITFSPTGSELQIKVKVVNSEPVRGARVRLNLKQNGRSIYNGYGSTNSAGEASYRWRRATGGEYLATVTYLRHSQYTWDESQGVTSASYTLGSTQAVEETCDIVCETASLETTNSV